MNKIYKTVKITIVIYAPRGMIYDCNQYAAN